MYVCMTLSPRVECDSKSIFKLSKAGLNLEFTFSYTDCRLKPKECSLPYLAKTWEGKIDELTTFLNEMRTVSSRIWTQVTDSIFNNDNPDVISTMNRSSSCVVHDVFVPNIITEDV